MPPDKPNDSIPTSRVKLPVWKKLFFGGVATVLFFVGVEVLLLAVGVQPISRTEDPYVGFSSYSPLFTESADADGQPYLATAENKTKFFNHQRFPKRKGRGTRRIFCVGGSTTFGRPYDDRTSFAGWLREFLAVADRAHNWEIVNAGGISYASYRVTLVMKELIHHQPDLFVIYCGHNEFLERRTYSSMIEMPVPLRGLGALLSRTRTYSWVRSLINGQTRSAPEAGSMLPAEVDTILDNSVGPDAYRRADEYQAQVLAHYRYNLIRMVEQARSAGAEVILVTPASNLRDCAPFKSVRAAELGADEIRRCRLLEGRARKALAAGDNEDAVALLDSALRLDSRYAVFHYLRGRALYALGRYEEAKRSLLHAADEDVCPLRALTAARRILRDVASQTGAPLVDFAAICAQEAKGGIPGEELFLDHVHPTIDGNRLLARAILQKMGTAGMLTMDPSFDETAGRRVAERVRGGISDRDRGVALRNLAQVLDWAGKHAEAGRLALQAAQLVPEDAFAQYLAGCETDRRGDIDAAIVHYDRAVRLRPTYVRAYNNLGLALAKKGKLDAAVRHFTKAIELRADFAPAHHNLGVTWRKLDRPERALKSFARALTLQPDNPATHQHVGSILARQGKLTEAAQSYARAVELAPDSAPAHYNLAVVFARAENWPRAIQYFQSALDLDPAYDAARRGLERAKQLMRERRSGE